MDVIILKDSEEIAREGARRLCRQVNGKPDSVLGLATGSTPLALYDQLVRENDAARVSFRSVTTFNLDEYVGLRPTDEQSYRAYMQRNLFEKVDINIANTHLPECRDGENPKDVGPRYESLIRASGGIDLQILGIGRNGHIGFNEPTSSLKSRTRVKTLTRETIDANRPYFDDEDVQPQLAITMGIGTIMDARKILLLATGKQKAEAVRATVEGPVSALWPASVLQFHPDVTIFLDEAAASSLSLQSYYRWVRQQNLRLDSAKEGSG